MLIRYILNIFNIAKWPSGSCTVRIQILILSFYNNIQFYILMLNGGYKADIKSQN